MSAMCVSALSVKTHENSFLWSQNVIAEIEKTVQARIDRTAAEIFERAGRPAGKELQARMAAERQLSLSRVRLIECPDSITLFAFVPDAAEKRLSVFLTSRGVAVRSPRSFGADRPGRSPSPARPSDYARPSSRFSSSRPMIE